MKQIKAQVKHPPYQDYAGCSYDDVVEMLSPHKANNAGESGAPTNEPQRARRGAAITFPMKLHELLESLPKTETAISWQHHGRAFKVRDKEKFAHEILPTCFCYESHYASFQRQLNIYAFLRISGGPDEGAYYNPLFLRSRPELCTLMSRKVSVRNCVRQSVDATTEPDLCDLPPMPYISYRSSTPSNEPSHVLV